MALSITAQNDYIIAKTVTLETESALARVDSQPKQQRLEVLAVGPEVTACKVSDYVLPFGQEFQAFEFEGEQFIVLHNHQILGVLDPEVA